MPSVYDFRHVELDKVGRGKRILTAPGAAASNTSSIFNGSTNGSEGSDLNSISDSGSVSSLPSTPVNGMNGLNGSNGNFFGDNMSECSATPPSSASSSRRGSLADTKNRLFGAEPVESPRRRVVDRMKSNIFSEHSSTANGSANGLVRSASVKKYDHVVRRNPITGEVYEESKPANGHNGINGANGRSNGVNGNGSTSLPATPVKVRQPPGGKCSGIF